MSSGLFRCFWVTKGDAVHSEVVDRGVDDLPKGDVLVRVAHSSLNYKDALAATGHPGVVRKFPHVPGIDAAGTVEASASDRFQVGQQVLVSGFEFGVAHWGGWSERIRVPADWVVPLPDGWTTRDAMAVGTAGFTAALCVEALRQHEVMPETGPVIVTGASGGVGSFAVQILARLGYEVTAVTGKPAAHALLQRLGAASVVGRDVLADASDRPLLSGRWAGAVDTVGGQPLATLLKSCAAGACVAACGLVAGGELPTTVYPFILRGVTLAGIDAVYVGQPRRTDIWNRLAGSWKVEHLDELTTTTTLDQLDAHVASILRGEITGRVVVELDDSS